MSQVSDKSTDPSDAALLVIRQTVLSLLPHGPLRDQFEAMSLDELRNLQPDSPLWLEMRAATGDPERRRLH